MMANNEIRIHMLMIKIQHNVYIGSRVFLATHVRIISMRSVGILCRYSQEYPPPVQR